MNPLETARLTIRNYRPDDWQQLQEMAVAYQATEAAQYDHPWPTSEEEVKGMANWFASGDDYLAVCLKDTGRLIGLLAIKQRENEEKRVHGLGYVFHPVYQGQGYGTEACQAAVAYLFDELGADQIVSSTAAANGPSRRLLGRLGFVEVSRHVGSFRPASDGTPIEFEDISFVLSRGDPSR